MSVTALPSSQAIERRTLPEEPILCIIVEGATFLLP
jgi:hypothetical protein